MLDHAEPDLSTLFSLRMVDPTLAALFLSMAVCLGLLYTFARRRDGAEERKRAPRALVVFTILNLAWTGTQVLFCFRERDLTSAFDLQALQRIASYFLPLLAITFLQITRVFERRESKKLFLPIGGAVILAASILLLEIPPFPADDSNRSIAAYSLLVGSWLIIHLTAIYLTLDSFRGRHSPLHHNRNLYWAIALLLIITGQSFFFFNQVLLSTVLHTAGLLTSCYAVLTHHLPDLRTVARRGSGFIVISILTIALYTAGYAAIQTLAQRTTSFQPILAGALLAITMVLLVNPLLGMLQRSIQRSINGSRYDPNQMLSEYSMSISNILNLEYLAMVVVGIIGQAMDISHGALIIVHREPSPNGDPGSQGYTLRIISESGQYIGEGRLPESNPVVSTLRREHRPLTQYDIDLLGRFQAMDANERSWLSSLDIDVYVPIFSGDAWIGILALGPKSTGERYYKEDLSLLQTLADQTAVALENARLYEDLKQRNTENEILNIELRQANKELARLDEAKSDFINIASHELRTPLTQVIGYNDILGEMVKSGGIDPREGKQMIDSVRKAARRLEEIVETMFDMSKIESNTLDLACSPISMATVINNSIEIWKPGIADRKQTITVHGIAHLPEVVCDGKRLTQVFSNLIQNAIKSTPDGGHIRITGRLLEPENGEAGAEPYVEIIIEDNGIGIAQEDLERIFQKFYRVGSVLLHSSGDTKFKGAGPGLGLTIARGIVEAHGGRIWAESTGHDEVLRPGAKFHVTLPVKQNTPAPWLDMEK